MLQLSSDCLKEIFKYLNGDEVTLRSCLLVNHNWCKVAVSILWKSVWNYRIANFNILISCLPNESKEILHNSGIVISTSTSKPLFNYATFCNALSIDYVNDMIYLLLLKHEQQSQNLDILEQEMHKLFMNQS